MNLYQVDTTEANIRGPLTSLTVLYDSMPPTSGCESCEQKNKEDAYWCCRTMSPSMYYVEFLKIWEGVQRWPNAQKAMVMVRAIENYLSSEKQKGCVFWLQKCSVYSDRPLQCRQYGIISEESWNSRVQAILEREGPDYQIRPQCDLVKIDDNVSVTRDLEDRWFRFTKEAELRLGVSNKVVARHDDAGGSYRTFHDHIMLEMFSPEILDLLTKVRLSRPTNENIKATAETIYQQLVSSGVV